MYSTIRGSPTYLIEKSVDPSTFQMIMLWQSLP
jgi:hypothetical protein